VVIPTPRLLFIAALGTVPMVLSGSYVAALIIGLLWLAGAAVVSLIDAWAAPGPRDLAWDREHDSKLSLGAWNPVLLTATNLGTRAVTFAMRDVAPQWLLSRGETAHGSCAPGQAWRLSYTVFPLRRGDYTLGPAAVRYRGPLGLAWRQPTPVGGDPVKVYPNLLAIRTYEALLHRGHLTEIGLHRTRRRGEGTEFDRLRTYTPDDEYRRINWKATARAGAPIVVDYQVERSQSILVALDTGRLMSMRVPLPEALAASDGDIPPDDQLSAPRALTRLDYALNAAVLLSYVAQEYGDRIGLLAFSDRISRYVAPKAGRGQFLVMTEALYNLEAESTATDYTGAIGYLRTRNPRRSLIILFTDLAEADAGAQLVRDLANLVPRHLPLVVTLQDPTVMQLAAAPAADAPSVYQRAVAQDLLDRRDQLLAELRSRGVLTLDVSADQLSPQLINRYLEVKARGVL
jgi:uncharacterized protein (DUF58 family)